MKKLVKIVAVLVISLFSFTSCENEPIVVEIDDGIVEEDTIKINILAENPKKANDWLPVTGWDNLETEHFVSEGNTFTPKFNGRIFFKAESKRVEGFDITVRMVNTTTGKVHGNILKTSIDPKYSIDSKYSVDMGYAAYLSVRETDVFKLEYIITEFSIDSPIEIKLEISPYNL